MPTKVVRSGRRFERRWERAATIHTTDTAGGMVYVKMAYSKCKPNYTVGELLPSDYAIQEVRDIIQLQTGVGYITIIEIYECNKTERQPIPDEKDQGSE
jgi:hypothetical protein